MMDKLNTILNYSFEINESVAISVKAILLVLLALFIANMLLKFGRRFVNRQLDDEDKGKFKSIFSFLKYFIYVMVLIIGLESSGVDVSVLLAGSAALMVGLGLGMQTLFQDIISGVFIIIDKTLHVNDIIEVDGKIGKVFEIKLRTTRALTVDNRVLVVPNHKFLTHSLFNWTQNGTVTTEVIDISVAYGSDIDKVKQLLLEAASAHRLVLNKSKTDVLFMDFGDSGLHFRLVFTINDSFSQLKIKSDLRYAIEVKFRENGIEIPFPQRAIRIVSEKEVTKE